METYTELKEFAKNSHYQEQRRKNLCDLTDGMIEMPVAEVVKGFNKLPCCFTLQSCYGHFVHDENSDPNNLESLPVKDGMGKVEYRIAYIALCIENSLFGRELFEALKRITKIDPENIQFICAEWFWERQINSYALQVEPDRFKDKDRVMLDHKEALCVEKVRAEFFSGLLELVKGP